MAKRRQSRRKFLQSTVAGALATTAGPVLLGIEDKSKSRKPVLGSGEYRYVAEHGWGELPSHIRWGNTHGVGIDEQGFIYITHQNTEKRPVDAIAVFDPAGKFVRSFGKEYHRGGHGLDIRKEGNQEFLYLSDIEKRRVVKTDLKGEHVWEISYPLEAGVYKDLKQFRPTNVCFAPDGGFYVGDGYGSHYIHQYSKNAKWVRTWGGKGKEPGKLATPHGLWLDDRPGREPALVVADKANARLQYFSLDGKYIGVFDGVSSPAHFDTRGDVLLVSDLHAEVTLLGKDNKVLARLGRDLDWLTKVKRFRIRLDPKSWIPGKFVHPHDACFDQDGNIFVVEWVAAGRVTKLRRLS